MTQSALKLKSFKTTKVRDFVGFSPSWDSSEAKKKKKKKKRNAKKFRQGLLTQNSSLTSDHLTFATLKILLNTLVSSI